MNTFRFWRAMAGCVGVVLGGVACGGGGSAIDAQTAPIEAWRSYCVATFPQGFESPATAFSRGFTANAGDEYLIARFFGFDGRSTTTLLLLTPAGPQDYDLRLEGGAALPYTTSCDLENTNEHLAVFATTTLFREATLATPLCELPAGTVRPLNAEAASGHSLADAAAGGDALVYEISLNALGAECAGAETGFARVPPVTVRDTSTHLVPIRTILGPA